MTKNQRARLERQMERLIGTIPPDIVETATADLGVFTSRVPERHRADAARLRAIATRIANDNG